MIEKETYGLLCSVQAFDTQNDDGFPFMDHPACYNRGDRFYKWEPNPIFKIQLIQTKQKLSLVFSNMQFLHGKEKPCFYYFYYKVGLARIAYTWLLGLVFTKTYCFVVCFHCSCQYRPILTFNCSSVGDDSAENMKS